MIPSPVTKGTSSPSSSLESKTVLVAGATGGIGEGITLSLIRAGAHVIAAGRDRDRLDTLARYIGSAGQDRLILHEIDVSQADSAAVQQDLARPFTRLDGVVIAIGNWGPPGRCGILETSDETWNQMVADNLTSHFRALRSLTPLLDLTGALVHLSGFSAEIPYPYSALVGATNAAKKSLVRSLMAELGANGPRIYELIIGPIRTRPRAAMGADSPAWLSAEQLGDHIAGLISGSSPFAEYQIQYLLDHASGVQIVPERWE
ncbi:MAG: SDR family NAD(P)-dependent oxidoreductase [Anaerolineaceae bacterium]|nr:SDR family NAD(P)-dependent oxidoreductase [Anaerolineaceae bacterium]